MFGSNSLERGLTFIAVTLILRSLPAAQAGGFVFLLRATSISAVFITLGVPAAAVRMMSSALADGDDAKADAILSIFFWSRLLLGIALVLGGWFVSPVLARLFLHKPSATPYLRLAFVGAATNTLVEVTLRHLQARQQFGRYVALNSLSTAGKLTAIATLLALGFGTGLKVSLVWVLVPMLAAIGGLYLAPRQYLHIGRGAERKEIRRRLYRQGRWLAGAGIASILFVNLDTFLLGRYRQLATVGEYGAAMNLSMAVFMLSTALAIVLLPAVSRLKSHADIARFFRRSLIFGLALALLLAPAVVFASPLFKLIYGTRYLGAVSTFRLLYLGAILSIAYNTAGLIFYALDKPGYVAAQNFIQLGVSLACYLSLIPRYGMIGGAIGTFGGHFTALLFVAVVGSRVIRNPSRRIDALLQGAPVPPEWSE
jgi:O-antigen/teichoic acid export membrane protein